MWKLLEILLLPILAFIAFIGMGLEALYNKIKGKPTTLNANNEVVINHARSWFIKRAKKVALKRDKVCQVCGTDEELEIHHLYDLSTHPELASDPDNLVATCRTCHYAKFHIDYMGGSGVPTTKWNFIKFITKGN